jgi:hypothetical protein
MGLGAAESKRLMQMDVSTHQKRTRVGPMPLDVRTAAEATS